MFLTLEGHKRYNELFDSVLEDRRRNGELFLKRFLDGKREDGNLFTTKRRTKPEKRVVVPRSELAIIHEQMAGVNSRSLDHSSTSPATCPAACGNHSQGVGNSRSLDHS